MNQLLSELETGFVLVRTMSAQNVMASFHPIIGPLYFDYVDESSVGMPDHYGLTDSIEFAFRFASKQINKSQFMSRITNESFEYAESDEPIGMFRSLAKNAGTTPSAMYEWFVSTTWVEFPAPSQLLFLEDMNGFTGYTAEWTKSLQGALRFSAHEKDDTDDAEMAMLRKLGRFVSTEAATALTNENGRFDDRLQIHREWSLEADVAVTMEHLQRIYRTDRIDYAQRACQLAADSGRFYFGREELPISAHIEAWPELRDAFNVGYRLQSHFASEKQDAKHL